MFRLKTVTIAPDPKLGGLADGTDPKAKDIAAISFERLGLIVTGRD
jgi:hypothetical protein